ncbi:gamma subclass chorismate mutase AroQ [Nonomuraea sp. NPDC050786]|uniref:gamma subclass chorismate mutase AroQ n=1 Tax=Nonomuraea sp. NPDC050786 TaxID=3154840 RepID=UPI0033C46F46
MPHLAHAVRRHAAFITAVVLALSPAAVRPAASVERAERAERAELVELAASAERTELSELVELIVRRILLAGEVAAAKFAAAVPITDPVRERQLLDAVAVQAARSGLAPETAVGFFRAQIEASKLVQRGLHERWRVHPALRPRRSPDLATAVRPRLDRLTPRMLRLLRQSASVRAVPARCRAQVTAARTIVQSRAHLDRLHRDALNLALPPICA